MKLSYQEGKGFKKSIGKHVGKDGSLKWTMWWLGPLKKPAERQADFIQRQWKELKSLGIDHWTDTALERIEAYRATGDETATEVPVAVKAPKSKGVAKGFTTHQATDLFRDSYMAGNHRAESTRVAMKYSLDMLKKMIPNEPMLAIGSVELQKYVNKILSLPKSDRTGKKITLRTAKNLIDTMKQVFDHADMTEIWNAPKRFGDLFRGKVKLKSTARKLFDIFELKALWKAADETQRLYLLLMLNCGFTSVDIAELRFNSRKSLSKDAEDYSDGETFSATPRPFTLTKTEQQSQTPLECLLIRRLKRNISMKSFPLRSTPTAWT
jgi:hypothetical protein